MGCFFSSNTTTTTTGPPTAKVIDFDGSLKEYAVPVIASTVLATACSTHFLCNSDKLLFDSYIPTLHSGDPLEADQIYFILPLTKLKFPLSSTDMAEMAVKACSAIAAASMCGSGTRIWVAPEMDNGGCESISISSGKSRRRSSWRLDGLIPRQLSTIEEAA